MSTKAMMPISTNTLHYHTILFELSKPVIILPQIFNEIWPYVDSVYSKLQQELLQAYGTIYYAICGAGIYEGAERLKELGGSSLKTKDIMNLKRRLESANLWALPYSKLFEDDILHACSLLKERGWLFEQLHIVDSKWQLRYIMTNDSTIEQHAIRLAFLGLNIKNRELCKEAIAAANEETAKYICTYWLQNAPKWAIYARQHSPFLLQATTTNACEAWHYKLKSGAGLSKGQVASHRIYGMILNIIDTANDIDN
ncbi:hypothetical protein L211DRAFT_846912 [Terfezia boudieri ATCC MYA-4762]|uniref:Uncharacterized protein n=1 Tax=Terfezia boudieri ATCC MYA-4762 TaxID=1051890 RepID=A0A3N4LV49_9PEZI|nr:hypothetical protein L211DRAFT_846912 [Terfezia boudieri ATCC MYA-4762]